MERMALWIGMLRLSDFYNIPAAGSSSLVENELW